MFGNTRHNVGKRGAAILVAAFVAGMAAAIGDSLNPSSWTVDEPFFGLRGDGLVAPAVDQSPVEAVAVIHWPAAPLPVASPAVPPEPPRAPALPSAPRAAAVPKLAAGPSELIAQPVVQRVPQPAKVAEPTLAAAPLLVRPSRFPPPRALVRIEPIRSVQFVPTREKRLTPPLVSVADEQPPADERVSEAVVTDAPILQAAPAAPLPGATWSDPDRVNWVDEGAAQPQAARVPSTGRVLERITERLTEDRGEPQATQPQQRSPVILGDRLRSRLRGEGRLARGLAGPRPGNSSESAVSDGWPTPVQLLNDLEGLAASRGADSRGVIAGWANDTLDVMQATLDTAGPADPLAGDPLLALGERVAAGMAVADEGVPPAMASQTRRAALAVARRVAVWRAAAAWCTERGSDAGPQGVEIATPVAAHRIHEQAQSLLACLERYETSSLAVDAATVRAALVSIAQSSSPTAVALARAVSDHYHAANVRVAVHRDFVSRMLPESTVTSSPVQDFVLGHPVRGRSTVEQSVSMRFVPHPTEIRMELVVNGEVDSRTVTASGPVAIHSKGQATFSVHKPITVTPSGLAFGAARGTALSRAQLASIETSFDKVPIMAQFVRSIAKSQHDSARQEANREVSNKVLGRACRQVDQESEPKLGDMAERIRESLWRPLVTLGLEPTPVALETTEDIASARLRLAAATQLAAHTPRPRAPADALVSFQAHETVANNAIGQFGFAGQRLELPQLARLVCERLGIDPQVPDDLPDDVAVTFASQEPLRVECRDGLIHIRVSLEAFEYGRRKWYDIVAKVAYRPVVKGPQVFLEREGPVQIGGPGHEGRLEIGLRTVFGKIFAKERHVPLVPVKVIDNPRLVGLRAVQAVATDGWLAVALADALPSATGRDVTAEPAAPSPTASNPSPSSTPDRRFLRR